MKVQNGINSEMIDIRGEMDAYSKENLKSLERIDKIDWHIVNKAELLAAEAQAEFKSLVDSFETNISHDLIRWKRTQTDLSAKYENITLWVNMQMRMN